MVLTTYDCAIKLKVTSKFIINEIKDGRLQARRLTRASGRTAYRIESEDFERYKDSYWPTTVVPRDAE